MSENKTLTGFERGDLFAPANDAVPYERTVNASRDKWRGLYHQLCDDILKVFVEYGYVTPEKTYRDSPDLLISGLRAIIGGLHHPLVNEAHESKEHQQLVILIAALKIYADKENWNQKDMRTGAFDWFMPGNAGWDIAEFALAKIKDK